MGPRRTLGFALAVPILAAAVVGTVVDSMRPLGTGDRAVSFLVAGGSDEQPYHAVVDDQGRYEVEGDTLRPSGADPLAVEPAGLGLEGLGEAVGG